MDFILPQSMFNIALFDLVAPLIIEMVDLARYLSTVLQVICLVNL